jgi:hypothetical protein
MKSGSGPFAGYQVEHFVMVGHSQTGDVVTRYVLNGHERHGLSGGGPIYTDGNVLTLDHLVH